jgi:hypothetical protein
MEAIERVGNEAGEAMGREVDRLEPQMRSLQRTFYACAFATFSDSRPREQVGSCMDACQEPLSNVQETYGKAQEAFSKRIGRCHEIAGETVGRVEGKPTPKQLEQYAAELSKCAKVEIGKLPALMAEVEKVVGPAEKAIRKAIPADGPDVAASFAAKKGWF